MFKKRVISFLMMVAFSVGMLQPATTQAAESAQSGTGFTMKIKTPAKSLDPEQSYFNLLVQPGDSETLTLQLQNLRKQTRQFKVTPVSAYTNNNGYVDYKAQVNTAQSQAKYQFTDMTSEAQTVTVAGNATKEVSFSLSVPQDKFAGIMVGGFRAADINQAKNDQADQKGFTINNRYAMLMGATVQETKQLHMPELSLGKITPTVVRGATTLSTQISNQVPTMFGQLNINATVTKRGQTEVLHKLKRKNLSMAPASTFNYQMDWNHEAFKPGKYTLHLKATSGTKHWNFDEPFTITATQAKRVNDKGVNLKRDWSWLLILLLILLILLLLIAMYYYGKYRARKDAEKNN